MCKSLNSIYRTLSGYILTSSKVDTYREEEFSRLLTEAHRFVLSQLYAE